ncbi:hypothetical protein PCANC_00417 [Puccinia coronata f. sp. avenae]|uniref:Uncharacterized protein n=1 Tax=Puccinia coronata f. sp. avenae TaxID=200324 RepID=A0A2N5W9H1_9BASI|nr:hypothetical protein PCANC_11940 [Puccinia coronata f. sp. avenae]PLW52134.1 hypothetical protein PCASD_02057 [Puccinia coronata f. sp. avenae]PLW58885.1 hypothetical protein PCANC_00417 [Puccinia coronata f. sp. avenae]
MKIKARKIGVLFVTQTYTKSPQHPSASLASQGEASTERRPDGGSVLLAARDALSPCSGDAGAVMKREHQTPASQSSTPKVIKIPMTLGTISNTGGL